MGNFEKLVVLTVLFLSAIVLAVSLSSDEAAEEGTPFLAAERMADGGGEAAANDDGRLAMAAEGERRGARTPAREAEPEAPAPEAGKSEPEPTPTNAQGHPRVLRVSDGLTPSRLPEYRVYVPEERETWSLLATRFYGSATYVPLLRAANEDLSRPRAGEALLVPVYDFRAAPADRRPREAAPPRTRVAEAASSGRTSGGGASDYEVVEGDNLWKIAEKVYGSGARWMDLYEANRDTLPDPDSLQVGMTLSIPR